MASSHTNGHHMKYSGMIILIIIMIAAAASAVITMKGAYSWFFALCEKINGNQHFQRQVFNGVAHHNACSTRPGERTKKKFEQMSKKRALKWAERIDTYIYYVVHFRTAEEKSLLPQIDAFEWSNSACSSMPASSEPEEKLSCPLSDHITGK